jgi:hypothetical protein
MANTVGFINRDPRSIRGRPDIRALRATYVRRRGETTRPGILPAGPFPQNQCQFTPIYSNSTRGADTRRSARVPTRRRQDGDIRPRGRQGRQTGRCVEKPAHPIARTGIDWLPGGLGEEATGIGGALVNGAAPHQPRSVRDLSRPSHQAIRIHRGGCASGRGAERAVCSPVRHTIHASLWPRRRARTSTPVAQGALNSAAGESLARCRGRSNAVRIQRREREDTPGPHPDGRKEPSSSAYSGKRRP